MSLSNARLFDPNLNHRVVFGTAGPAGPPGPIGPPGPGSSPMTPSVEGTAFGATDMLGRTQLGYLVDNSSSNNIGLWSSSSGIAQEASNSTSSFTAFTDTLMLGAQLQNGVYLGEMGSIRGSNLSNCLFMERNSILENLADFTENILLCNNFTANSGDSITRSIAAIGGQFTANTAIDEGILIGDMSHMSANANDVLCLRTPGSFGTLTMANNTAYIGNGQVSKVMNPNEFLVETYGSYFLKTLRADTTSGQISFYDPATGELTYGPASAALAAKQPTTLGGQYGISSLANAVEINGRSSFNNYAAVPAQLQSVSSVGAGQYATSVPASNSFTNDIFLGRTHQFPGATSIQNTLIAANIVGNSSITKVLDCNMIVPRASSLTFGYSGEINGANFVSSGLVSCTQDPLYSTVLSSGGTVNPGATNLVLASDQATGVVTMNGTGNTLIKSSSSPLTYIWPAGISNTTVIQGGNLSIAPTASVQLCASHTTFRMPNITNISAAATNQQRLMIFDTSTGLISPSTSTGHSRVFRAVGTTNAAGQVTFSTGSLTATTAGVSMQATVQNTSTTTAYTCSINAIAANSVVVQVFNSVTVVLSANSMATSGAGITVHFVMAY